MTRSTDSPDAYADRSKAVLICPACGYESDVTDNWLEVTGNGVRALVCPACGEVIDHRPARAPRPPAEAD